MTTSKKKQDYMGRVLDCPVCNAWATISDTRALKPGIVRRKY